MAKELCSGCLSPIHIHGGYRRAKTAPQSSSPYSRVCDTRRSARTARPEMKNSEACRHEPWWHILVGAWYEQRAIKTSRGINATSKDGVDADHRLVPSKFFANSGLLMRAWACYRIVCMGLLPRASVCCGLAVTQVMASSMALFCRSAYYFFFGFFVGAIVIAGLKSFFSPPPPHGGFGASS